MKLTEYSIFKNRQTQLKTLLKLGLFLLIIAIGLTYLVNLKVKEKIAEIVGLECEKIDVNVLLGKADFNDIKYNWTNSNTDSSNILCKNITLSGIKWWQLIAHKQLKINELHINNIQGIIKRATIEQDSVSNKEQKKPQLESIFINKIFLDNINIEYTKRKHFFTKIENFQLQLNQLEYDLTKPIQAIKYQGFECSLKNGSWIPKTENYAVHCNSLEGNMNNNSAHIKGLKLQPLHHKKDWYQHFKYKKARLKLITSDIIGTDIDYKKLLNGEGLNMKNLAVENLNLDIHIDKKLPPCIDCYKPLLHEKLLTIKFPINIEIMEFKSHKIAIEIINEKNELATKVDFQKTFASIYNLTNEQEKIKINPKITADLKTLFLGEEELDANITFDLADPMNSYQLVGKMNNMDLTTMNDFLKFGTKAKIKSGILNQLNFKIDGNQEVATGRMAFSYDNLEIEIMNQEKSKSKKLFSKLVNKIGIKKDNSNSEGNFKEGKIFYTRKKNKGTFHQWWRAIQSGFQSTIMPDLLLPDELEED